MNPIVRTEPTSSTHPSARYRSFAQSLRGPKLFWLLAIVAQVPLLLMYLTWVWRFEHYQYFPFLLMAVSWLTWSRISSPLIYPSDFWSIVCFCGSIATLLIGSVLNSPWFAPVSFVFISLSFLRTHELAYLCVPLLLLIRLPLNYDVKIITVLQAMTTRLSSFVLDLIAVPHLARGNVIDLPDRELFVAEACSGVQSTFTIAFLALLIVAWRIRPLALVPVYLAIACAWAVLSNTLRVTLIAYAASRLQVDLSTGFVHDLLGYSMLLLAALLTLSTDSLLQLVFHPLGHEQREQFNPFVAAWERLFRERAGVVRTSPAAGQSSWETFIGPRRWVILAGLALQLVSIISLSAHAIMASQMPIKEAKLENGNLLVEPPRTLLDDTIGPVQYEFIESMRHGTDPRLGKNADQWKMHLGSLSGVLTLSQPYPAWHELSVCYVGSGWDLSSTTWIQPSNDSLPSNKIKLARFSRIDGVFGHLLYVGLNADGSVIDAFSEPLSESFLQKTLERCEQLLAGPRFTNNYSRDCAMLQVWIVAESELDSENLSIIADSISQVRDRFAELLSNANAVVAN